MLVRFFRATGLIALGIAAAFGPVPARAQDAHEHTPAVSGVPQGVPYFCAVPSVTSVASGPWSDVRTWSTRRVPGAHDAKHRVHKVVACVQLVFREYAWSRTAALRRVSSP